MRGYQFNANNKIKARCNSPKPKEIYVIVIYFPLAKCKLVKAL